MAHEMEINSLNLFTPLFLPLCRYVKKKEALFDFKNSIFQRNFKDALRTHLELH
jgi:hypothetical protein